MKEKFTITNLRFPNFQFSIYKEKNTYQRMPRFSPIKRSSCSGVTIATTK